MEEIFGWAKTYGNQCKARHERKTAGSIGLHADRARLQPGLATHALGGDVIMPRSRAELREPRMK
jgi:hypothetical protein